MARVSGDTVVDDAPAVPLPYIRRWLPEMFDDWLMMRLEDRWPGFGEQAWRGKLSVFARSNDYLFLTNGDAVFLGERQRHAMTGRPVVLEVLAWARSARQDKTGRTGNWILDDERPLVGLYRNARQYAAELHAARIISGTCSDLPASKLRQLMQGDYLVDLVL